MTASAFTANNPIALSGPTAQNHEHGEHELAAVPATAAACGGSSGT
jgi:hypothetical protein